MGSDLGFVMKQISFIILSIAFGLASSVASAQAPLVSPLTRADMEAMSGGMSCEATVGSKTMFYDDGDAIIRVGGTLVKLGKHGSVPSRRYTAMGGALAVTLTKRAGKSVANEEGSRDPMTLAVTYRNATQSIPVVMNCSA
jgi:hypothetical protein